MKDWVKTGLGWAIWMFIMMTFIMPLVTGESINLKSVLISLVIWTIAGFGFGYTVRKKNKEKGNNCHSEGRMTEESQKK